MKIQSYISVVSLVILLCFVACKESTVTTPTEPVEEITIEDYVYNADSVQYQCRQQHNSMLVGCAGTSIISVSKNKDRILAYGPLPSDPNGPMIIGQGIILFNIQSNHSQLEPFDFTSLKSSVPFEHFTVLQAHFSPYDNDLLLMNIASGKNQQYSYDWYYYKFSTKIFTRLALDSPNHSYYKNSNKLVRWLNTSTHGNDQFLWENNSILSHPSGNIQQNATGRTFQENEKIFSISPDLKKVFTVIDKDLYLNGNLVPNSKYIFRRNTPISWSEDSQKFLGIGLPQNPNAFLNIVYEMKKGSTTDFSILKVIDITRKHCSIQTPTSLVFPEELHTIFITDSTIAMNIAKQTESYTDISLINFNGDILQKYTMNNR